jgi:hypothetical protein
LVAYVSADVAHHVLGHGGACLALRGQVESLSSVHVKCSVTGSAVDLAGPVANLIVGVGTLLGAHFSSSRRLVATHLFCTLAAAFNLFWFGMQLVYSAATKTDDWAWAIQQYHVAEPVRYMMIVLGVALYTFAVRAVGHQLAPFAQPLVRARVIAVTAWVTAGGIAILTAALDHNASSVMLRGAVPQSLLLHIGLLFAPARARFYSLDRYRRYCGWSVGRVSRPGRRRRYLTGSSYVHPQTRCGLSGATAPRAHGRVSS